MKIHIIYSFVNTPYGGANQFLKALKKELGLRGLYADSPAEADIVLFNSNNLINDVIKVKIRYPDKVFVHRVDGPCRLYNNDSDKRDEIVFRLNSVIADATVFQSYYSRRNSLKMGYSRKKYETVIHNGCDQRVFYKRTDSVSLNMESNRIRIIATSFSDNWNKGFRTYQWIDDHIDFSKYEMIFVGNSPCEFRNIRIISPRTSQELSEFIRQSDIYITASENDPCSNSMIEAISCGLPVLARNSGGHPELVKNRGLLFDNDEDIPKLLYRIVKDYDTYLGDSNEYSVGYCACLYESFFDVLLQEKSKGEIPTREIGFIKAFLFVVYLKILKWIL